jgi:hypothetical protein
MGACLSSESNLDVEQKKKSQMIDKKLEEDSRRLRRECKILLLGGFPPLPFFRALRRCKTQNETRYSF